LGVQRIRNPLFYPERSGCVDTVLTLSGVFELLGGGAGTVAGDWRSPRMIRTALSLSK
jgi:hypothetical protein